MKIKLCNSAPLDHANDSKKCSKTLERRCRFRRLESFDLCCALTRLERPLILPTNILREVSFIARAISGALRTLFVEVSLFELGRSSSESIVQVNIIKTPLISIEEHILSAVTRADSLLAQNKWPELLMHIHTDILLSSVPKMGQMALFYILKMPRTYREYAEGLRYVGEYYLQRKEPVKAENLVLNMTRDMNDLAARHTSDLLCHMRGSLNNLQDSIVRFYLDNGNLISALKIGTATQQGTILPFPPSPKAITSICFYLLGPDCLLTMDHRKLLLKWLLPQCDNDRGLHVLLLTQGHVDLVMIEPMTRGITTSLSELISEGEIPLDCARRFANALAARAADSSPTMAAQLNELSQHFLTTISYIEAGGGQIVIISYS